MIKIDDIPEYAGLIYIKSFSPRRNPGAYIMKIIKKAPILHNLLFEKWEQIAIKLFYKNIQL